jgi:hypothetical protein
MGRFNGSIGGGSGSAPIVSSSEGLSRQGNSNPVSGPRPTVAFGCGRPEPERGASPRQPTATRFATTRGGGNGSK